MLLLDVKLNGNMEDDNETTSFLSETEGHLSSNQVQDSLTLAKNNNNNTQDIISIPDIITEEVSTSKSGIPTQEVSLLGIPKQSTALLEVNNENNSSPSPSSPRKSELIAGQPGSSHPSLLLSDAVSVIPGQELNQRREALKLFSSQQSMVSSLGRSMNLIPNMSINYELTPFSSTLSSLNPLCRICQCPAELGNVLITPCRCDGSLKHIHATCLKRWMEVSSRKYRRFGPSFCELCGYIYKKHKYIKYRDWKWPKIAAGDKVLHTIFAVSLITMIGCAVATILCFITDDEREGSSSKTVEDRELPLRKEEIITICCGITFFVSFFISMSAEIKAKKTIYQICRKCVRHNTVWLIENYSLTDDPEYKRKLNRVMKGNDSKSKVSF